MASPAAVLSILITANTGGAAASLTRLDRKLKGTATTANTTSATVAKAAKIAGLGVVAGLGASVYAAAKFESAFAEVRKTVETNEKGFKRIEMGLRALSKRVPVSANELANLAGEAGALGVKSKDIVKFTKTASQLGTTTDMSASDASNALARLANIMDTKGKKAFQRMGSTLVDLGNKGASTEGEISDMALRIAGAGKTLGLTESQVLGLSASLANVGIRAEMGGSAISRVMLQMQEAIAKGGGELQNFADITGVTTKEFSDAFKGDAPRTIALFAQGLGELNKAGEPILSTLKGVELGERRVGDTLLRIAGNTRQFTQAQGIANKAWQQNAALTDEARERYKTLESQLSMLKNEIVDTAIGIGQELMPDVKEMVKILRDPKLTFGDKVAAIGNKLGDLIAEWGPKVAEAAAQLGPPLARGLVQSFLDAPALIQLATGAWLGTKALGIGKSKETGKEFGKRLGKGIIIGTLLALPALVVDVHNWVRERRVAIINAGIEFGEFLVNGMIDAVNIGIRSINQAMDDLNALAAFGVDAPNIGEIGHVDFGPMVDEAEQGRQDLREVFRGMAEDADRNLEKVSGSARKHGRRARDVYGEQWDEILGTTRRKGGQTFQATDQQLGKAANAGRDRSGDLRKGVVGNVDSMVDGVAGGMRRLSKGLGKALNSLGVKKQTYIAFEAARGDLGKQRGGIVNAAKGAVVPGVGSGDKVPLHMAGRHVANVEPGELVSVANRNATKALMKTNAAVPRFAEGGALNFALGPYDIPPIQYDPNHAGGNSHLHLSMNSVAAAKALAAKIGPMGWTASESPWAGGVTVQHQDPGHYDGRAFDANTAADETRAEVSAVARLLGGAGGGGFAGTVAKLARVMLKGPAGPLLDMGNAVLSKTHKAATDFLAKQMPKMSGEGATGALSPGQFLGLANRGIAITSRSPAFGRFNPREFSAQGLLTLAKAESSLIPSSINDWDTNAQAGDPSGGLMHLTQSNMRAFAEPGLGSDMFDGLASIAASINYQRDRYGGQVTHSPYREGGIVAKLKEGGIIDAGKLVAQLRDAKGPGDRRDIIGTARGQINKRTSLDVLSADGTTLAGALKDLRDKADEYASNADFAAQLGLTDDDGNLIPGSDVFGQHGQAGWITEQLGQLWTLRNRLVTSGGTVADKSRAIAKLVKRINGPKGLVAKLNERIRKIKKTLGDLEDARKELEDDLKTASDDKEKSQKRIQAKLDRELEKPEKKQDKEQIAEWRKQLRAKSTEKDAIREALGLNRQQTHRANEDLAKQTAVRDALRGPISSVIDTRKTALSDGAATLTDALSTVQGSGVRLDDMTGQALPELGMFKGEIGSAQLTLRELGVKQPTIDDASDAAASEREDILEQLLREANLRTAVAESHFATLRETPETGPFHGGGIVPGVGEKTASVLGGEGVFTPEQMQAMGPGGVTVLINGDIINTPRGKDPVEIVTKDKRFKPAVIDALRGQGQRVLA